MDHSINSILCLLHRPPNCDTHGHFCLIFGDIAILTNSSTLISKITVAKLKLVLRWSFRAFPYDFTVQIRSFHSFPNIKFNRSRNGFKEFYVYFKDHFREFIKRCFGVTWQLTTPFDIKFTQLWLKMWYLSRYFHKDNEI